MTQLIGLSFARACLRGCDDSHLARNILFEVRGRHYDKFRGSIRFSHAVSSQLLKWCSQTKNSSSTNISVQKLLEEAKGYDSGDVSGRLGFLNKVSVLMGYNNIEDLLEQEKSRGGPELELINDMLTEFDSLLISAKYPCIKFGESSEIKLYDALPTLSYEETKLGGSDVTAKLRPLPDLSERSITPLPTWQKSLTVDSSQNLKSQKETTIGSSLEVVPLAVATIDKPISCLPGATAKQRLLLENNGFHTVRKLLHYFPRAYADQHATHSPIEEGQYKVFAGTIISSRGIKASFALSFVEIVVRCIYHATDNETENCNGAKVIHLHMKKFFKGTRFVSRSFLRSIESKYMEGERVCVSGKVGKMLSNGHYEMKEYNISKVDEEKEQQAHLEGRRYPVYSPKSKLKANFLGDMISRALKVLDSNVDPIPSEIRADFNLVNLCDAFTGIHRPRDQTETDLAHRRLIFDEFFYIQLGRLFQLLGARCTRIEKEELLKKYQSSELCSVGEENWSPLAKKFMNALPYSLTSSQLNAVAEIIWDLRRPIPMYRLLQGDVGCGKTVVAFLACMEVIDCGFQAAFMVPTELLAIQHYDQLNSLVDNMVGDTAKPKIALLTGSTSSRESRLILQGLETGDIAMVIGTHSLIADRIAFTSLRIAVVDEQHRFGVIQRGRFNSKLCTRGNGDSKDEVYMAPHILALSATPIPRTLALALYGDMSLTQITGMPPGRHPVETQVVEGDEFGFQMVFKMMKDELVNQGKIYLVYPIIEESELSPKLRAASSDFDLISNKFEGYACGLLHGRMKSEEKDEVLKRFRAGDISVLLATQVIEIGVDVPDASMMVVMNAERFGLAQLHQLRGRVGRGDKKSTCILISSTASTLDKLKVLEKSSDGFYLAYADLLLRGPGDLLGKKQWGHIPEFPLSRLAVNGNILQEAHEAALRVLMSSHDLELYPQLKVELSMRQHVCILGD